MTHSAPRIILGGLLLAALAAPAQAAPKLAPTMFALPSDMIALELSLSRAARDKGQTNALRNFAADDAQTYDGGAPVRLADWARQHPAPAAPIPWDTPAGWMRCDGATAVTYGAWDQGPAHGWYSTVWQRQKKGTYRFLLTQTDTTAAPLPVPEFAEAKVADCPLRRRGEQPAPAPKEAPATDHLSGEAPDHTLNWSTTPRPDGGRDYVLRVKLDGKEQEVLRKLVTK